MGETHHPRNQVALYKKTAKKARVFAKKVLKI